MKMIRVSYFSAWQPPIHNLYPDRPSALAAAKEGRSQQLAVVLTNASDLPPSNFGTGIDDRTTEPLPERWDGQS